ncbi:GDP-mannose 4,6-dehydratase, partial [Staphylococcus haemolyticus]
NNLQYLPKDVLKEIEFEFGDIMNYESIDKATNNADIIYNLAALVSVPYSYKNSESFFDVNIKGLLNLLNSVNKKGTIERVIQMSSSEVYGSPQYTPINEAHPLQPQSPYAASKVGADALATSFYKTYGTPVTIARPFNTYGPRQSRRAIIPTIISQALHSSSLSLGNIDSLRDFNYIDDTTSGLLALLEETTNQGAPINIGSGYSYSIKDIIDIVSKLLNKNLYVNRDDNRIRPSKSEVSELLCDNTTISKLTSWKSNVSLEQGIQNTIAFFYKKDKNFIEKSNNYFI